MYFSNLSQLGNIIANDGANLFTVGSKQCYALIDEYGEYIYIKTYCDREVVVTISLKALEIGRIEVLGKQDIAIIRSLKELLLA